MMVSNRVVEHVRLQNEAKSADLDAAGEDDPKMRLRSGKLYRARSQLYRSQLLQENMRLN